MHAASFRPGPGSRVICKRAAPCAVLLVVRGSFFDVGDSLFDGVSLWISLSSSDRSNCLLEGLPPLLELGDSYVCVCVCVRVCVYVSVCV